MDKLKIWIVASTYIAGLVMGVVIAAFSLGKWEIKRYPTYTINRVIDTIEVRVEYPKWVVVETIEYRRNGEGIKNGSIHLERVVKNNVCSRSIEVSNVHDYSIGDTINIP